MRRVYGALQGLVGFKLALQRLRVLRLQERGLRLPRGAAIRRRREAHWSSWWRKTETSLLECKPNLAEAGQPSLLVFRSSPSNEGRLDRFSKSKCLVYVWVYALSDAVCFVQCEVCYHALAPLCFL